MLPIESDIRTQLIQEDRHREAKLERARLQRRREIEASSKTVRTRVREPKVPTTAQPTPRLDYKVLS